MMPMGRDKNEWDARLRNHAWPEWSGREKESFRQKQEVDPVDPVFAERYSKLCNALEAIWLACADPSSEKGEVDFDNLPPLVSDWSRRTASGILRILAGDQ
jgi:hypothetical protein